MEFSSFDLSSMSSTILVPYPALEIVRLCFLEASSRRLNRPSMSAAKDFSRPEAVIVAPATGSFLLLITFPLSLTDWENNTIEREKHRHSKRYFLATLHKL